MIGSVVLISVRSQLRFTETPEGEERKKNLRKPQSGKLQISIRGAQDLEHAPFLKSGRSYKPINDTTVAIKVEGTQRARTHSSRTDRWMEDFEIAVDKANEVEITIYDKQVGNDIPVPIGILWLNLNDIVEALRRAKVQGEGKGGGWVTAGAMNDPGYSGSMDPSSSFIPQSGLGAGPPYDNLPAPPGYPGQPADGIEASFSVVPSGVLSLHVSFGNMSYFLYLSNR